MIKTKSIYDKVEPSDGKRILVMRKWPRGIGREKNKIDLWMKDVGPSVELLDDWNKRKIRWQEYEKRYLKEMESQIIKIEELAKLAIKEGSITLLCKEKTDDKCHRRLLLILLRLTLMGFSGKHILIL